MISALLGLGRIARGAVVAGTGISWPPTAMADAVVAVAVVAARASVPVLAAAAA